MRDRGIGVFSVVIVFKRGIVTTSHFQAQGVGIDS